MGFLELHLFIPFFLLDVKCKQFTHILTPHRTSLGIALLFDVLQIASWGVTSSITIVAVYINTNKMCPFLIRHLAFNVYWLTTIDATSSFICNGI